MGGSRANSPRAGVPRTGSAAPGSDSGSASRSGCFFMEKMGKTKAFKNVWNQCKSIEKIKVGAESGACLRLFDMKLIVRANQGKMKL